MNLAELQTLVDFNYWARDRMLEAVEPLTPEQFTRNLGNSFPSIRDTLVHLYGAEWVWRSRWEGTSPESLPEPGGFPDLASLRSAWSDEERRVRAVVDRLGEEGIHRPVEYRRNADGPIQAQLFWHMLQHVVNHGSYHRGQVTTLLRQLGAAPPKSTDLIAFYRERANVST
jgi:uncharacterized damage-inducible protein DinB